MSSRSSSSRVASSAISGRWFRCEPTRSIHRSASIRARRASVSLTWLVSHAEVRERFAEFREGRHEGRLTPLLRSLE